MRYLITIILTAAILCTAGTVSAQSPARVGFRGWGPRLGLTIDPDQFHFGVHMDLGNFAQRVRFQPNFELGFGDNLMLAAINLDANYRFRTNWNVWSPYLGGGFGINIYDWDSGYPGHDHSDTEFGLNVMGGIEKGLSNGDRFFLEAKLGLIDAPDFKLTAGWTFFH